METQKLLDGETMIGPVGDIDSWIMTSREWAADQLLQVAHETETGGYPHHISAFDLGRAVGRALSNFKEDDPLAELVRGFTHYMQAKRHPKSN